MKTKYLTIGIIILILLITVFIIGCFQNPYVPLNESETEFCEQLYNEIEEELDNSNYCNSDSDCTYIMLGGAYIEFGCYHYINKDIDGTKIYEMMDGYLDRCFKMINKCAPAPEATCVSNKCIYIK